MFAFDLDNPLFAPNLYWLMMGTMALAATASAANYMEFMSSPMRDSPLGADAMRAYRRNLGLVDPDKT